MFVAFFVLPTPSSAPSREGGQDNLATHSVAQDCVFLSHFLRDACYNVSLLCVFSQALPPLAGLWVVPPFRLMLAFAFSSRHPPRWWPAGGF